MRALFLAAIVAVVGLVIQRVHSLSCNCHDERFPVNCNNIDCCESGELTRDVCGCCDVCAKVVCESYMPTYHKSL